MLHMQYRFDYFSERDSVELREREQKPKQTKHLINEVDSESIEDDEFTGFPYDYDVGLYWFTKGNKRKRLKDFESDKEYFDPEKPSVVYCHGWEPGTTLKKFRETMNWKLNEPNYGHDLNYGDLLLDKGYNLGIFYWNQYADEDDISAAEAKIFSTSGPVRMRWRKINKETGKVVYEIDPPEPISIAEIFKLEYLRIFSGNHPEREIRLVGHSLGHQVIIHGAQLLVNAVESGEFPNVALPTRMALLDPYCTSGKKNYLGGHKNSSVLVSAVRALKTRGITFEHHQSSIFGNNMLIGDPNTELRKETALMVWSPHLLDIPWWRLKERHIAAVGLYFLSMAESVHILKRPTRGQSRFNFFGKQVVDYLDELPPLSCCSHEVISELMYSGSYLYQVTIDKFIVKHMYTRGQSI